MRFVLTSQHLTSFDYTIFDANLSILLVWLAMHWAKLICFDDKFLSPEICSFPLETPHPHTHGRDPIFFLFW